ncbi:FIST N domain-containing protein [Maridesulfovibrio ferrireducens]|uniref:FIST N domain-containing protein n=1 Tax=Maridesulfovibrio ferrireducens TaxID=246191 RepID=A0A1G9LHR4_9BACT|nr:FIST C-terminal domain-containing protein [Maridesulfovibrio ferrireducens]SDL61436.1 FIST N domain-containing protein [Maridesulfovibrio ferrireducens]
MQIKVDPSGTVQNFQDILLSMKQDPTITGVIVFACHANGFTSEQLDPILTEYSLPVIGGVFPSIFHNIEKMDKGTVVVGLTCPFSTHIVKGLSNFKANYNEKLEQTFAQNKMPPTLLIFADAMAKRVSSFVQSLFEVLGLEITYIGGGAGSLDFNQAPCLMCNEGLLVDAAILAGIDISSSIGVKHGYRPVCGPFKVTESDHNVLKSLDWQPAFEVYRQAVNEHSEYHMSIATFGGLSRNYPFGLARLFAEPVVRDPAVLDEEGNIVCVGEVPEGSFVKILHGNPDDLIDAACQAKQVAIDNLEGTASLSLCIDCVSRFLFLQDDYKRELSVVQSEGVPLVGALTLGEIANIGQEYLDFHNKTVVVAMLENV